jgi:hypothetical protein
MLKAAVIFAANADGELPVGGTSQPDPFALQSPNASASKGGLRSTTLAAIALLSQTAVALPAPDGGGCMQANRVNATTRAKYKINPLDFIPALPTAPGLRS